jgi:hypothetical protein
MDDGLTIGGVIFTGDNASNALEKDDWIAHETVHTLEWATLGPAMPGMFAYGWIFSQFDPATRIGAGCLSLLERLAPWKGTGYEACP